MARAGTERWLEGLSSSSGPWWHQMPLLKGKTGMTRDVSGRSIWGSVSFSRKVMPGILQANSSSSAQDGTAMSNPFQSVHHKTEPVSARGPLRPQIPPGGLEAPLSFVSSPGDIPVRPGQDRTAHSSPLSISEFLATEKGELRELGSINFQPQFQVLVEKNKSCREARRPN